MTKDSNLLASQESVGALHGYELHYKVADYGSPIQINMVDQSHICQDDCCKLVWVQTCSNVDRNWITLLKCEGLL